MGGLADKTHSSDVSGIPYLSRIPLIGPLLFGRTTKSEATNELFLFLTPHIISSDEDIDRLREAVKQGSELLKDVDVTPHINVPTDTLKVNTVPRVRPDSVRPNPPRNDSLTPLRRRPGVTPRDTTGAGTPIDTIAIDSTSASPRMPPPTDPSKPATSPTTYLISSASQSDDVWR
jgi:hypothetical protein